MDPFFILGCGYTGSRVASLLLEEGFEVGGSARSTDALRGLVEKGLRPVAFDAADPDSLVRLVAAIPAGSRLLYSIPTLSGLGGRWEPAEEIFAALGGRVSRVVYLSTTGVYGEAHLVDETTEPAPATGRQRLRVAAERAAASGRWKSLILRPAAIYGPGRGVQVAMARGEYKLSGDGSNFVSRIHVDDLAAIAAAALKSDVEGAYPVADEEPCSSREICEFCSALLGVEMPEIVAESELSETRRSDRRVDGGAIRRLLGVDLRYPSYREGVPASLP